MKAALYVLMLGVTSATTKRQNAEADIVCWQENQKLQWTDFQATSKPKLPSKQLLPHSELYATTLADAVIYDRHTDTGEFIKTFVRVEFYKRKSWVDQAHYADRKATLVHEQLHFDITELAGRRLRRCLAKYPDSHTAAVDKETNRIHEQQIAMQSLCDAQTKAGDDLKAQARWQASIKQQLYTLRAYKSTADDCEMGQ